MDRDHADAVLNALTLETREARAAAQRKKDEAARALAGQKRMAQSAFAGFAVGALLGFMLDQQWHLPGLLGAAVGLIVGAVLRNRAA